VQELLTVVLDSERQLSTAERERAEPYQFINDVPINYQIFPAMEAPKDVEESKFADGSADDAKADRNDDGQIAPVAAAPLTSTAASATTMLTTSTSTQLFTAAGASAPPLPSDARRLRVPTLDVARLSPRHTSVQGKAADSGNDGELVRALQAQIAMLQQQLWVSE
jgi:hypothetical protein